MTHPDTTTCKASWINPIYAGTVKESWYCQEHKAPVFPYEPPTPAKASTEAHPDTPELDEILTKAFNDFYDYITEKDIIKAAHEYSTKSVYTTAQASLTHLLAKRELEGRIAEVRRATTAQYSDEATKEDVIMSVRVYGIARLAELREELTKYDNPKEQI